LKHSLCLIIIAFCLLINSFIDIVNKSPNNVSLYRQMIYHNYISLKVNIDLIEGFSDMFLEIVVTSQHSDQLTRLKIFIGINCLHQSTKYTEVTTYVTTLCLNIFRAVVNVTLSISLNYLGISVKHFYSRYLKYTRANDLHFLISVNKLTISSNVSFFE